MVMNRPTCALLFVAILPVLIGAAIWPYEPASSQTLSGTPAMELQVVDAAPAAPDPMTEFQNELEKLRRDLDLAISLLEKSFGRPVQLENVHTAPVTLTAYSSTPEQCDSTPHITASNKPVRHGVIAVSDDIVKELGLAFGQRVLIPGHGVFEVQDRMNRRWHRRVDIWHDDREAARLFGIQKGTMLWVASSPGDEKKEKEPLIAMGG
jgi:3D (Asp-Asp-Asp) domain-containing protein